MDREELLKSIRTVADFPKPGILFYDIGTLLADPKYLQASLDAFQELVVDPPDSIVAIESRGFIFGAALADRLKCGFIVLRKPGKLPGRTIRQKYDLEYGSAELELSDVVLKRGARVILADDVLATGGTAGAAMRLLASAGATVLQALFLLELKQLGGRKNLSGLDCASVLVV